MLQRLIKYSALGAFIGALAIGCGDNVVQPPTQEAPAVTVAGPESPEVTVPAPQVTITPEAAPTVNVESPTIEPAPVTITPEAAPEVNVTTPEANVTVSLPQDPWELTVESPTTTYEAESTNDNPIVTPTGTVQGAVYDQYDGQPIAGATITIAAGANGASASATTNAAGVFAFTGVPASVAGETGSSVCGLTCLDGAKAFITVVVEIPNGGVVAGRNYRPYYVSHATVHFIDLNDGTGSSDPNTDTIAHNLIAKAVDFRIAQRNAVVGGGVVDSKFLQSKGGVSMLLQYADNPNGGGCATLGGTAVGCNPLYQGLFGSVAAVATSQANGSFEFSAVEQGLFYKVVLQSNDLAIQDGAAGSGIYNTNTANCGGAPGCGSFLAFESPNAASPVKTQLLPIAVFTRDPLDKDAPYAIASTITDGSYVPVGDRAKGNSIEIHFSEKLNTNIPAASVVKEFRLIGRRDAPLAQSLCVNVPRTAAWGTVQDANGNDVTSLVITTGKMTPDTDTTGSLFGGYEYVIVLNDANIVDPRGNPRNDGKIPNSGPAGQERKDVLAQFGQNSFPGGDPCGIAAGDKPDGLLFALEATDTTPAPPVSNLSQEPLTTNYAVADDNIANIVNSGNVDVVVADDPAFTNRNYRDAANAGNAAKKANYLYVRWDLPASPPPVSGFKAYTKDPNDPSINIALPNKANSPSQRSYAVKIASNVFTNNQASTEQDSIDSAIRAFKNQANVAGQTGLSFEQMRGGAFIWLGIALVTADGKESPIAWSMTGSNTGLRDNTPPQVLVPQNSAAANKTHNYAKFADGGVANGDARDVLRVAFRGNTADDNSGNQIRSLEVNDDPDNADFGSLLAGTKVDEGILVIHAKEPLDVSALATASPFDVDTANEALFLAKVGADGSGNPIDPNLLGTGVEEKDVTISGVGPFSLAANFAEFGGNADCNIATKTCQLAVKVSGVSKVDSGDKLLFKTTIKDLAGNAVPTRPAASDKENFKKWNSRYALTLADAQPPMVVGIAWAATGNKVTVTFSEVLTWNNKTSGSAADTVICDESSTTTATKKCSADLDDNTGGTQNIGNWIEIKDFKTKGNVNLAIWIKKATLLKHAANFTMGSALELEFNDLSFIKKDAYFNFKNFKDAGSRQKDHYGNSNIAIGKNGDEGQLWVRKFPDYNEGDYIFGSTTDVGAYEAALTGADDAAMFGGSRKIKNDGANEIAPALISTSSYKDTFDIDGDANTTEWFRIYANDSKHSVGYQTKADGTATNPGCEGDLNDTNADGNCTNDGANAVGHTGNGSAAGDFPLPNAFFGVNSTKNPDDNTAPDEPDYFYFCTTQPVGGTDADDDTKCPTDKADSICKQIDDGSGKRKRAEYVVVDAFHLYKQLEIDLATGASADGDGVCLPEWGRGGIANAFTGTNVKIATAGNRTLSNLCDEDQVSSTRVRVVEIQRKDALDSVCHGFAYAAKMYVHTDDGAGNTCSNKGNSGEKSCVYGIGKLTITTAKVKTMGGAKTMDTGNVWNFDPQYDNATDKQMLWTKATATADQKDMLGTFNRQ